MARYLILLAALALGGCAVIEDHVEVPYRSVANVAPIAEAQTLAVNVSAVDGRISQRDRISTKKNGYGMEMAKITATNHIPTTVRSAIEQELKAMGFRIDQGGIRIDVTVRKFYNTFEVSLMASAVGEVEFAVKVYLDNVLVFAENYAAVHSDPVFLASGDNAAKSLSTALGLSISKMMNDASFIAAMRKNAGKPRETVARAEEPRPSATPPAAERVAPPAVRSIPATRSDASGAPVLCYSPRRDALVYVASCTGNNQSVDDARADQLRKRFAASRTAAKDNEGIRFEPPIKGSRIETQQGTTMEVVGTEDQVVSIRRFSDFLAQVGWFYAPGSAISLDRHQLESIWPLKVGKEASFRSSSSEYIWEHRLRVLRKEMLTLPTGRFETYVVERHQAGMAPNHYDAHYTYWYSPELRMVVKFDLKVNAGNPSTLERSWEVKEITIPTRNRAES